MLQDEHNRRLDNIVQDISEVEHIGIETIQRKAEKEID